MVLFEAFGRGGREEYGADCFHLRSFINGTGGHLQVGTLKNKSQNRYNHWQILLQARLSGRRLQAIKYFVSLSKLVNKEKVLPHKSLELMLTKSAFSPGFYFNTLQLGESTVSLIYASSSSLWQAPSHLKGLTYTCIVVQFANSCI